MKNLKQQSMRMDEYYDSAQRPFPALEEILALIKYRELIRQFVTRSIKTRYKRSVLGILWTLLNPLLTMVVLTIVSVLGIVGSSALIAGIYLTMTFMEAGP